MPERISTPFFNLTDHYRFSQKAIEKLRIPQLGKLLKAYEESTLAEDALELNGISVAPSITKNHSKHPILKKLNRWKKLLQFSVLKFQYWMQQHVSEPSLSKVQPEKQELPTPLSIHAVSQPLNGNLHLEKALEEAETGIRNFINTPRTPGMRQRECYEDSRIALEAFKDHGFEGKVIGLQQLASVLGISNTQDFYHHYFLVLQNPQTKELGLSDFSVCQYMRTDGTIQNWANTVTSFNQIGNPMIEEFPSDPENKDPIFQALLDKPYVSLSKENLFRYMRHLCDVRTFEQREVLKNSIDVANLETLYDELQHFRTEVHFGMPVNEIEPKAKEEDAFFASYLNAKEA
jgi:hypothetical protein